MPHAIVTGASSGIGKAVAIELARRGHDVGLIARRASELQGVADEIAKLGKGKAFVAPADVGDKKAVLEACAACEKALGPCDLLCAGAGVAMPRVSKEKVFDADGVEFVFRVNVLGVAYAIEAVLPGMLARKSGRIAAISSLSAYLPLPRSLAYPASKAGLNILLESLRIDLRGRGVGVTVVNPGFVDTPMTAKNKGKMPFLVEPTRAAKVIVDGMLKGKRLVEFPLPLVATVHAAKALIPARMYDWMVAGKGF